MSEETPRELHQEGKKWAKKNIEELHKKDNNQS
jgi:hypothetical protein